MLTVHVKGHDLDLHQPLSRQAASVRAELEACDVLRDDARIQLLAGDVRALARLHALEAHVRDLQQTLTELEHEL